MNCSGQVQHPHNVCVLLKTTGCHRPAQLTLPSPSHMIVWKTNSDHQHGGKYLHLGFHHVLQTDVSNQSDLLCFSSPGQLCLSLKPFYFDNNERTHLFFVLFSFAVFAFKEGRSPDCRHRNNAYLFSKLSIKKKKKIKRNRFQKHLPDKCSRSTKELRF